MFGSVFLLNRLMGLEPVGLKFGFYLFIFILGLILFFSFFNQNAEFQFQDHQSCWLIFCTHGSICLLDGMGWNVNAFFWIIFLGCFELTYSIGVLLVLHDICLMKFLLNLMWDLFTQPFFPPYVVINLSSYTMVVKN